MCLIKDGRYLHFITNIMYLCMLHIPCERNISLESFHWFTAIFNIVLKPIWRQPLLIFRHMHMPQLRWPLFKFWCQYHVCYVPLVNKICWESFHWFTSNFNIVLKYIGRQPLRFSGTCLIQDGHYFHFTQIYCMQHPICEHDILRILSLTHFKFDIVLKPIGGRQLLIFWHVPNPRWLLITF